MQELARKVGMGPEQQHDQPGTRGPGPGPHPFGPAEFVQWYHEPFSYPGNKFNLTAPTPGDEEDVQSGPNSHEDSSNSIDDDDDSGI